MQITSLVLEQFRCYPRLEIEPGPGLNILVGANASGKTSILEAIYLLAVTRSHRTSNDRDLIKWGSEWGRVAGEFSHESCRSISLRITLRRKSAVDEAGPRKIIELNHVPRRKLSEVIGQTAVVFFGPDNLALVKGAPSERRHFLNEAISQVRPMYLDDLLRYRRALRQRNELLKLARNDTTARSSIPGWDVQLADCASRIANARADFLHALAPDFRRIHHELSGAEAVSLQYSGDLSEPFDVDSRRLLMRDLLTQNLERDIVQGRTSRGPHRDDINLMIGEAPLRTFGSQGQQRTAALSLTLAEAEVLHHWSGAAPIVLLDDCLSELDEARARRVLALTESVQQMIVTTASWDRLLEQYADCARVFDVSDNQVVQRGKL